MMDRLTESNPSWIDDELWERACEPDCEEIDAVYRKLKEYEDLEEQGLLLRLPCKVGDTVYRIENGKITQTEITKYDIYTDGSIWFSFSTSLSLPISKFKTCIFFTQAEAEQKLKEMSK